MEAIAPPLSEGRYQLVAVLGQGGMATVYRAWDHRLGVERAIKVLAPALTRSPRIRTRFENEARTMARLDHPNVLKVVDVAEDGEHVFLVMELARGGSLADLLEHRGPVSPRLALELLKPVVAAVGAAHAEGVVHRDIKPQNILLTETGKPLLTDFGIAQVTDPMMQQNLTRTGTVMGTWAYMSPEQRSSARQVDNRSDIYALGATLYTVVRGQIPPDLFAAAMDESILAELVPEVAEVVRRATGYRPEERYPTAAAMAEAMQRALEALPEVSSTDRRLTLGGLGQTGPRLTADQLPARSEGGVLGRLQPASTPVRTLAGEAPLGTLAGWIDGKGEPETEEADPVPRAALDAARAAPTVVQPKASLGLDPDAAHALPPPIRRRLAPFVSGLLLVGAVLAVGLWQWGPSEVSVPVAGLPEARPAPPAPAPKAAEIAEIAPVAPVAPPLGSRRGPNRTRWRWPAPSFRVLRSRGPPDAPAKPHPEAAPPQQEPRPAPVPTVVRAPDSPSEPARISVEGDAEALQLKDLATGERRAITGPLPPGSYEVLARFAGQASYTVAGRVQLSAGQTLPLRCDANFRKCIERP